MKHRAIFVLAALLLGCKQEPIVTVRVPKEAAELPAAAPPSHADFEWSVPAGWTEKAPSQMRTGSFSARGENGKEVDISVVALSGDAGGDLANVNRWRDQIGLPAIISSELDRQSKIINPAGLRMRLVDFENDGKRVIATIYFGSGKTWFFKMTGDSAATLSVKPAFSHFLQSLRPHAHDQG